MPTKKVKRKKTAKKPTTKGMGNINIADRATHRDFVFERRSNVDKMIGKLKASKTLQAKFFKDPEKCWQAIQCEIVPGRDPGNSIVGRNPPRQPPRTARLFAGRNF